MARTPGTRPRSGCALFVGILLITTGTLLLARNVFDFSVAAALAPVVGLLVEYWPALLVIWGGFKIYQRAAHPETARVSGFEVFLLFIIVVVGLGLRAGRHIAMRLELDDYSVIEETFALAPPRAFEEEHEFELPDETTTLTVVTDRGAVRVRGWDEPRVQAVVSKYVRHASETGAETIAGQVEANLRTSGELAELDLTPPNDADVEVELDLLMPRRIALVVKSRRGPVRVSDLTARVEIATSHDDVEVEGVSGDVEVSTRHESIRLDGITGSVHATNRHGPITASRVGGDLTAETRNGAIRLEDISGATTVRTRHGSVRVHRVEGELTIDGLNSEIDVENARSRVFIETSNHDVFVRDVALELEVDARNATIIVRNAQRGASLRNRYGPVTVLRASGAVGIEAPQSAVVVESVDGDVDIKSSHEALRLSDVRGAIVVEAEHAPIRIAAQRLDQSLSVHTSYGDVELEFPFVPSGRYRLRTSSGELDSQWSDAQWSKSQTKDGTTWLHSPGTGDGEPLSVDVITSYGNIVVREP